MTYGLGDIVQQRRMIAESDADEAFKRISSGKLDALIGLAESAECRRKRLLGYFGEASEACGNCDVCLNPPRVRDGTQAAQKALSCVYRTGQRFGPAYLIDVLRGNLTERVRQSGHHEIKTWSVGADMSESGWRAVFRQLVALGYLRPDTTAYGALKLTEAARGVLKGEVAVALREQRPESRRRDRSRDVSAAAAPGACSPELLEALRKWRLGVARELGIPAFVIFHDSTLQAIAAARPRTLDALRRISGIGATKLERYGEAVLAICGDESIA
jgi:ATP-dependent DNA helicase RecQ